MAKGWGVVSKYTMVAPESPLTKTPVMNDTKMSRTKNQSITASKTHTGFGQRAELSKHSRNGTITML